MTRFSTALLLVTSLGFAACANPSKAEGGPHHANMEATGDAAAEDTVEDYHPDDPNVMVCPATGAVEVLKPGDKGYQEWTPPADEN